MSDLDLTFVLAHPRECTEGVTRRDEFQPCDKPAVAVRIDPECGEPYPVCARHARADMVPLPDLIAAARAQVAAEIRASRLRRVDALPSGEVKDMYERGVLFGLSVAVRIARGES